MDFKTNSSCILCVSVSSFSLERNRQGILPTVHSLWWEFQQLSWWKHPEVHLASLQCWQRRQGVCEIQPDAWYEREREAGLHWEMHLSPPQFGGFAIAPGQEVNHVMASDSGAPRDTVNLTLPTHHATSTQSKSEFKEVKNTEEPKYRKWPTKSHVQSDNRRSWRMSTHTPKCT